MDGRRWSDADFDEMSWHDAHVHGFRLTEIRSELGSADLVFDIDYILQWIEAGGQFQFKVAQASLTFHQAFGLRVALDYQTIGAGMGPFSLSGITRRNAPGDAVRQFWALDVNWPSGRIEFEASGFTQVLVGPVLTQPGQSLENRI
jgi:hypothetical protein